MRDSITLIFVEYSLWVGCIGFLGWATYRVLRRLIREDLSQYKQIKMIYRYSSIIGIVAAALFSILVFRVSNRFLLEELTWRQLGLSYYLLMIIGSLLFGYSWMHIILRRYESISNSSYSAKRSDQYARNILVFMVSTSFFSLLLAAPSIIEYDLPELRELCLALFLGACGKFLLGSYDATSYSKNLKKKLPSIIRFFS